ncbi:MAG: sulfotransferase family 2 domain-containing protein [Cyanobacteria bacterium P01_D01_bin.50]
MLIKYNGEHKFIFVANTKCASASIEKSKIAEVSDIKEVHLSRDKHLPIEDIYTKYSGVFENYKFEYFFKFGVIRNPLDWIVSWYNFRSRPELKDPNHPTHRNYTGEMTFADFWHSTKNNKFFVRGQSPMFFSPDNNSIKVNYLAKLETLIEDLSRIKGILGIDSLDIPKVNTSIVRITSDNVEESIKKEITTKYSRDYELINNLESFNSEGLELFKNRTF